MSINMTTDDGTKRRLGRRGKILTSLIAGAIVLSSVAAAGPAMAASPPSCLVGSVQKSQNELTVTSRLTVKNNCSSNWAISGQYYSSGGGYYQASCSSVIRPGNAVTLSPRSVNQLTGIGTYWTGNFQSC